MRRVRWVRRVFLVLRVRLARLGLRVLWVLLGLILWCLVLLVRMARLVLRARMVLLGLRVLLGLPLCLLMLITRLCWVLTV